MKKCPVCESSCFDDMEVCFGCMHRFSEDTEVPKGAHVARRPLELGDIDDVFEALDEPPEKAEPQALRATNPRVDSSYRTPAPLARRTGRASLRRGRTSAGYREREHMASAVQMLSLPEGKAQYNLVVSLQPIGMG